MASNNTHFHQEPPVIEGIPVSLGDVISGPPCGPFSTGRIKGWSPDGRSLYVGWLGVVAISQARWVVALGEAEFPRLYRPNSRNAWSEAIALGMAT